MSQEPPVGQTEILLGTVTHPVFPFFLVKFTQAEEKEETYMLTMKVRAEIYNYIKAVFGKDEVTFYLDPLNGEIRVWTPSMHASFEFVQRLGLMSAVRLWIQNARSHLARVISGVRPPS